MRTTSSDMTTSTGEAPTSRQRARAASHLLFARLYQCRQLELFSLLLVSCSGRDRHKPTRGSTMRARLPEVRCHPRRVRSRFTLPRSLSRNSAEVRYAARPERASIMGQTSVAKRCVSASALCRQLYRKLARHIGRYAQDAGKLQLHGGQMMLGRTQDA